MIIESKGYHSCFIRSHDVSQIDGEQSSIRHHDFYRTVDFNTEPYRYYIIFKANTLSVNIYYQMKLTIIIAEPTDIVQ